MVEKNRVEIDQQQSTTTNCLSNEQWQPLIALHCTLLYEHHDFFFWRPIRCFKRLTLLIKTPRFAASFALIDIEQVEGETKQGPPVLASGLGTRDHKKAALRLGSWLCSNPFINTVQLPHLMSSFDFSFYHVV